MQKKVKNLVVDTTAFIKNAQLQDFGINLFTVQEVVDEVRCKRQLRKLAVLPYNLQVKEIDSDSISTVTDFAKKTGDILYLSATDIKLIALTYQLEKELVGTDHLRKEPVYKRTVEPLDSFKPHNIPGFYMPHEDEDLVDIDNEDNDSISDLQEVPDIDTDAVLEKLSSLSCKSSQKNEGETGDRDVIEEGKEEATNDKLDPCVTDSDAAGWITPFNMKLEHPTNINTKIVNNDEGKETIVACLTTDFSMQNVLKQFGLNVISLDGMLIHEIRTFVLRCYACFHITPQTTRTFCPKCGNKTLKRVSVTVDEHGKQHIQINFRRPLTARGKKFPIPRPKGGKHAANPILCEDQRVPQQCLSKLALTKNNPMHPDYIAGDSPFIMRDVVSKSAILNTTKKTEVKYWMRKNPNEVVKRRRTKR